MKLKQGLLILLMIMLFGCCHTESVSFYPAVLSNEDVDKEWVIRELEDMKGSHVRNRGAYNRPEFDDYCVEIYDAVIGWINENSW